MSGRERVSRLVLLRCMGHWPSYVLHCLPVASGRQDCGLAGPPSTSPGNHALGQSTSDHDDIKGCGIYKRVPHCTHLLGNLSGSSL